VSSFATSSCWDPRQKADFDDFLAFNLQALQDDDGKMIIEGSGVDITDKPEWWDYNYFSYIVPADRVPSYVSSFSHLKLLSLTRFASSAVTSSTSMDQEEEEKPIQLVPQLQLVLPQPRLANLRLPLAIRPLPPVPVPQPLQLLLTRPHQLLTGGSF